MSARRVVKLSNFYTQNGYKKTHRVSLKSTNQQANDNEM